jgi:hypothetical protein
MAVGAAMQLSLCARLRRPDSKFWLLPPFCLLVGWLVGALNSEGTSSFVHFGAGYTLVMAAALLATEAPARIDEEVVLALTTAFWLTFGGEVGARPWLLLALPPTLGVAALAFTRAHPPLAVRVVLYAWTLLMLLALAGREWPSLDGAAGGTALLLALYAGSHAAQVAHNIASLVILLPLPVDEDMSWKERWKMSAEHARRLAAAYAPDQVSPLRALAVVVAQCAFVGAARAIDGGGERDAGRALLWLILTAKLLTARPIDAPQPPRHPTTGELHRARRAARQEPGIQPG